ncbi:AMP-binding protein [Arhodomonas sp. AD133]|uniref:AMP-binding protein n=1 Tax=Arhodomonas sp. AD133 TaxID=3415009 RepID=UPI003EB93A29
MNNNITKFWLKHYPKDVPTEIDPSRYRSLVHLLEESFRKFAGQNAYVCMDKRLTYAEVDDHSRKLGGWLQSTGMEKGGRVAVMMPNVLQYPIAVAAVLRAGYTVVNVNPLYTARELEHQLRDSGAEAIIILENFATTLERVIDRTQVKHVVVADMGEMLGGVKGPLVNFAVRRVKKLVPPYSLPGASRFREALTEGARIGFEPVSLEHDDIAFLQYTGGTTGVSKGATLTHRNVIANVLQNDAWARPALKKEIGDGELTIVCALPLYHILGLTACMLMGTRWGAKNILIPNPRDIAGVVKELVKYRFNFFPGVNTLFNGLMNNVSANKSAPTSCPRDCAH